MNFIKTFLLLTGMTLLLMWLGARLGGTQGMAMALVFAAALNFGMYWFSDKIVLAMYGARDPKAGEEHVVRLVERLTQRAKMPMPRVKVMDTAMPNAFATGRNPQHAVVAVTTGILAALSETELEAVLAHELSHVRHRDTLTAAIAATLAGAVTMIARMAFFFGGRDRDNALGSLLLLILAPIAAMIIQLAISRSREYAADRGAGLMTENPQALVDALAKLHRAAQARPLIADAGGQVTAHFFIVNPFKGGGMLSLFSTHPSFEQRAERLRHLAEEIRAARARG
jgi:heat shock protein HtpX